MVFKVVREIKARGAARRKRLATFFQKPGGGSGLGTLPAGDSPRAQKGRNAFFMTWHAFSVYNLHRKTAKKSNAKGFTHLPCQVVST
jgi:hypothetical protein